MTTTLVINEIYRSVQGESSWAGLPCVFVRLTACNLRCVWCDSTHTFYEGKRMSLDEVLDRVEELGDPLVEITGGEPLLQPESVRTLARFAHESGGRTWLETHGGRINELAEVIGDIDVVSMDMKLPSSSGDWIPLDIHRLFLEVAVRADVFVKIVITPETADAEVLSAAALVALRVGMMGRWRSTS